MTIGNNWGSYQNQRATSSKKECWLPTERWVVLTFSSQSLPKMVFACFILTQFHYHHSQKLLLSTTSHRSCLLVPYLPKSKSHHWTFQCKLTDIICCCFVYVSTTIWWIQTALFLEDTISDKITLAAQSKFSTNCFYPSFQKNMLSVVFSLAVGLCHSHGSFSWPETPFICKTVTNLQPCMSICPWTAKRTHLYHMLVENAV